jgi:UDP-glucuronate decarboxylase
MRELANLVVAQVGSSSPLTQKPLPQDDPKQRQPNITLAKNLLGWSPKVDLSEGLKPTIGYFREIVG